MLFILFVWEVMIVPISNMTKGMYMYDICICMHVYQLGMGDYENMSQRLLFLQVSRLLRLLATLHLYTMYVDFIQQ